MKQPLPVLVLALALLAVISQAFVAVNAVDEARRTRSGQLTLLMSSDAMLSGLHTGERRLATTLRELSDQPAALRRELAAMFPERLNLAERVAQQLEQAGWASDVRTRARLGRVVVDGETLPALDGLYLTDDGGSNWRTDGHFGYFASDDNSGAEILFELHLPGLTAQAVRDAAPQLAVSALVVAIVLLAAVAALRSLRARRRLETQKDVLIDMLAHELNTPLTTIELATGVLKKNDDPAVADLAAALGRQSLRLRGLVRSAVAALGDDENLAQSASLPAAVDDAIAEARAIRPDREIRVQMAPVPGPVRLEPQRLRTVLANLLDNALKYSPAQAPVEVCVASTDHGARVRVTNPLAAETAASLPPDLAVLTDRLVRGESDARTAGLGLGLSVAARSLAACGGWLRLRRTEQGFEAEATFPVAPP